MSNIITSIKLKNALLKLFNENEVDIKLTNTKINGQIRGCYGFITNKKTNLVVYVNTENPVSLDKKYMYRFAENTNDFSGYLNRWSDSLEELTRDIFDLSYNRKEFIREPEYISKHIRLTNPALYKAINNNSKEGFTTSLQHNFITKDQLDCFWQDNGIYATITNGDYTIEAGVYGDLRYKLTYKHTGEYVISEDATDLYDIGIDTDKALYELIDGVNPDYEIEIFNNKWIELPIYDANKSEYITYSFDSTAIIPDTNNIIEAIDGGFDTYINEFTENLENGR